MKIGIRNGALAMEPLAAIEAAAQLGYDSVELDIGANYAETIMWQAEGRRSLYDASRDSDCEIASLCLGVFWQISPASRDEYLRAEASELTTTAAAFATELGAQWMLLPVTPGGDEVDHDECSQRWIEEVSAVAPVAEDLGVHYCLENVGRGCGKSAADLLHLVLGIDSPAVGVYYDIGNAVAFDNDPVEEIQQLGELIRIVHVKDHEGAFLGEGIVPIEACMKALVGIGYDGYLVLETPATDDPMVAGARNLEYLRNILDTI